MSSQGSRNGLFADINVTPLVDITLVLLIIVMVAAPLIISHPSIKMHLPKASTGDQTDKSPLSIALEKKDGGGQRLTLNGSETDEAGMRAAIPALVAADPAVQAIIAADEALPYREVVRLVDLVKALGVRRFALNTEPAGPEH